MKKIFIIQFITVVIAGLTPKVKAETYNVNPSMSVTTINTIIANADGGNVNPDDPNLRDTIHFEEGTYNLHILGPNQVEYYNFLPNRNYTFDLDGVVIDGGGLEHGALICVKNSGNMNISGNLTLQDSIVGIDIFEVPYKDINISGVHFYVYEDGIGIQDREHETPLEKAAVAVSYCTANGGDRLVNFGQVGDAHETSPYSAVTNCTLINLTSDVGAIEVPWYAVDDETLVMLGGDEIYGNVLIGCYALSNPNTYQFYNSPHDVAYTDVDEPYLDGENCFIADPNSDFLPDGITPRRDGRLNLGEGNYIGSIEPYHELEGNLNFDEIVDILDLAVASNRFNGDLTEVLLVASDWLSEEPTDPLGNPK